MKTIAVVTVLLFVAFAVFVSTLARALDRAWIQPEDDDDAGITEVTTYHEAPPLSRDVKERMYRAITKA